ncbi:MAG: CinA family protein [Rickettsiella sp.]|nr:CinA family protein [Rickettsiella sp.]
MTHISQVHTLAKQIGNKLKQYRLLLATAESCTGGQLAQTITSIPGSSAWFERGFITYSPLSKQELLGVQASTLKRYGVASQETAEEMAKGVLKKSPAHISIAITGIAGPEGGTKENPVGTLYFAWAHSKPPYCKSCLQHFDNGERLTIRYAAVEFALKKLIPFISIAS